jgi:NTE family protein
MSSSKLILALGGGGARGVAHLGVIEVLLDAGFEIDRIVGVSIGSLAGALFAFDPDIRRVQQHALQYLLSKEFQEHQRTLFGTRPKPGEVNTGGVFSWYSRVKKYLRANQLFYRMVRSPALLPGIVLHEVVEHLLPDADIAAATIPLSIVAVDLRSGHKVVLERGSLRDAVRGSSSLPGIFPPVDFGGMSLCDVGVFDSLPTTVARSYGPQCLVAVDVSTALKRLDKCESAFDVLVRMDEIGEALFRKHVRSAADIVICPEVAGIEWFDFSSPRELLAIGRKAGHHALARIKAHCGN